MPNSISFDTANAIGSGHTSKAQCNHAAQRAFGGCVVGKRGEREPTAIAHLIWIAMQRPKLCCVDISHEQKTQVVMHVRGLVFPCRDRMNINVEQLARIGLLDELCDSCFFRHFTLSRSAP